jgi:hypothetical protein
MKKTFLILFTIAITGCGTAQKSNNIDFINIEKDIFKNLQEKKCDNIKMHAYINKLGVFHMERNGNEEVSTYKLNSNFSNTLTIAIYNEAEGFRFVTPNNHINNYIADNGELVERHQEDDTFFLVYKLNGSSYLINNYEYKGRQYYLVDTYCGL